MIYEVRANFYFASEDEARDFFNDCIVALPKATVIHPCQPNMQFSQAALIQNNHDIAPPEPCEFLSVIDNEPICP